VYYKKKLMTFVIRRGHMFTIEMFALLRC